MKLLHTADLHMDRSFEGLTGIPTALAKRLREANQQLLMNIVTVAIRETVDLVIFAGDTFHQSQTSISMQAQLMAALEQLKQAEIPVILTFGNHDYYKKDRYWFSFPDNVKKKWLRRCILKRKRANKWLFRGLVMSIPGLMKIKH